MDTRTHDDHPVAPAGSSSELDLFAETLVDDGMNVEQLPDIDAAFNCVGCFGTASSFGSSTAGTNGCFGCASG